MGEVALANDCVDLLQAAGFSEFKDYSTLNAKELLGDLDNISYESRFMTALSILTSNIDNNVQNIDRALINDVLDKIDDVINQQVAEVLAHDDFRKLEKNWRSLQDLAWSADYQKTKLSILDVSKEELADDFECSSVDIASSDLFKKVYIEEYDQYGGEPYGSIIGLYSFDKSQKDIDWLTVMGKVSEASHAPFIGAAAPELFGCANYGDLADVKDIDGLMAHPRFAKWNAFRKTKSAGYIGLTLPHYMIRPPYDPNTNPVAKGVLSGFKENVEITSPDKACLWGNASILFAKNLFRSFDITGWCQSICGPRGGGLVEGLPVYNFNYRDPNAYVLPVDFLIPDNKEYSLAKAGFISLVYEKKTTSAAFFSAQSAKASEEFEDPIDTENSQLVTKLPYTFSVCKMAHYIKCVARDHIGSETDEKAMSYELNNWISKYVTTVPNPNALTTSYYPFKAASVNVKKKSGMAGWYNCNIEVLPHIKFEGMDVILKLDTRLG